MQEVLTGIVNFWQGVGPAVQAKAISMDAVKAISMTIVRRARMGLEVEDALESGMQQPEPQADPEAGKAEAEQAKQQAEAAKAQAQAQADAAKAQADAQAQAQKEQLIAQREAQQQQLEAQTKDAERQHEAMLKNQELQQKDQFERWKAELDAATKIMVAQISAKASLDASAQAAQKAQSSDRHGQTLEALRSMMATMSAPKEIVRGPDGRAVGLRVVGGG